MKNNSKVITIIFCILYFIWGFYSLLESSVNLSFPYEEKINLYLNIIIISGLILCYLLLLYLSNYNISIISLIGVLLLLVLSVIPAKYQLGIIIFTSFEFIIVGGNIDYDKILLTFILFSGITLIYTVILNKLDIAHNFITYNNFQINNFQIDLRIRSSLGFKYYSYAAQIYFYWVCAYIVYRKEKIKYTVLIILEIINLFIFYNTNTRNPYWLTSCLIGYIIIKKITRFKKGLIQFKIFKVLFSFSFPICFFIVYWLSLKSSSKVFTIMNEALSGRLLLNLINWNRYGTNLFGQYVYFNTISTQYYNYVDSAYFQNLIINGIIFFIVIIVLFTVISITAVRSRDDILAIVLLLIAVHAIFDPQLLWAWYSPFPLLLGRCFNIMHPLLNLSNNSVIELE